MTGYILAYIFFGAFLVCAPAFFGHRVNGRRFPSAGAIIVSAIAWPLFVVIALFTKRGADVQ